MKSHNKLKASKNRQSLMNRRLDDPKQSKRFIEAAREAEADETEEGAKRAFKKVTRPPKTKNPR